MENYESVKENLHRLSEVVIKLEKAFEGYPILTALKVLIRNNSIYTDAEHLQRLKDVVISLSNYDPEFHLLEWIKEEVLLILETNEILENLGIFPHKRN